MEKIKLSQKETKDIRAVISELMELPEEKIENITYLTKGMTNHSYIFEVKSEAESKKENKAYIIRVPGEGTDQLIDRENEAIVYKALEGHQVSDIVVYISGEKGYKITEYWADSRTCDPLDEEDVKKSMKKLKQFHNMDLEVPHTFDVFKEMNHYESLREGKPSMFEDYEETKKNIDSLKPIIDALPKEWTLAHIDCNPDNILFVDGKVRFIDWEYGGMQDPHFDIGMFAIYSGYDKKQTDFLIDAYFTEGCSDETRAKIYAYMAISGLLWSNWCEYKGLYGFDYGDYTLSQYQYAKDYYVLATDYFLSDESTISEGEKTHGKG